MEQFNKTNWLQKDIIRFFSKINYPGNDEECWPWIAGKDKDGYGDFQMNGHNRAHRLSYEYYFGSIPKGLSILHKCDNPSCCNPNHLFLGTNKDNMKDMTSKNRQAKGSHQGTSKFTEQDIINIINDIYNYKYVSMSQIARKYLISVTMIRNIINGSFWSHVTNNLLVLLKIDRQELKNRVKKPPKPKINIFLE